MTPREQAEKIKEKGLDYNGKIIEMNNFLRPYELELDSQHVDTLKDLAIVSGAIAALSLTIFSTTLPRIGGLLIIGISLLLINVFYIFWYLISRITGGNKRIIELRKVNVAPLQERVKDIFKFSEGNLTYDEFVARDEEMVKKAMKDIASQEIQPQRLIRKDELALAILGVALICIVSSFLAPYL